MNENGEKEEEDEHRGVKISSTKIWVFRSQNGLKKMAKLRYSILSAVP